MMKQLLNIWHVVESLLESGEHDEAWQPVSVRTPGNPRVGSPTVQRRLVKNQI